MNSWYIVIAVGAIDVGGTAWGILDAEDEVEAAKRAGEKFPASAYDVLEIYELDQPLPVFRAEAKNMPTWVVAPDKETKDG